MGFRWKPKRKWKGGASGVRKWAEKELISCFYRVLSGRIKWLSGHTTHQLHNLVSTAFFRTGVLAFRTAPPGNDISFPATSVRTRFLARADPTSRNSFSKRFLGVFIILYLINHLVQRPPYKNQRGSGDSQSTKRVWSIETVKPKK